jgi:hypothetical protein
LLSLALWKVFFKWIVWLKTLHRSPGFAESQCMIYQFIHLFNRHIQGNTVLFFDHPKAEEESIRFAMPADFHVPNRSWLENGE